MKKRHEILKDLLPLLKSNDILIFIGETLTKEAYNYDREGSLYIPQFTNNISLSLPLGVAMCTNKRVFVFCDDSVLIEDLSSVLQAGVSECKNLFYVVFNSKHYQDSGFQPVITKAIRSLHDVLRSSGLITFDYTLHFNKKKTINGLQGAIKSLVGPGSIVIEVDKGISKLFTDSPFIDHEHFNKFNKFVNDGSIGTSLYSGAY